MYSYEYEESFLIIYEWIKKKVLSLPTKTTRYEEICIINGDDA